MSKIELSHVTKTYPGGVLALDDIELTIEPGEFMVLVGPSGCGKSTLLRSIAGLEEVSGGTIRIGERDVTHLPPPQRDIAMVFQTYALYPHMTVRQNLGYGLSVRKTPKKEIERRVDAVAALLGLAGLLERRPVALSGGQRQRVAMGRAIVREPVVYLMDEPLSNLDAKLRVSMRAELARLHERLGVTTVYVTHDQLEAMTLGQRVAVMQDGKIQQVADPHTLYTEPANLFVASFVGSPAMNLIEGELSDKGLEFGGFQLELGASHPGVDGRVIVGIRPEHLQDAAFAEHGLPEIEVEVAVYEDLGSDAHLIFAVEGALDTADTDTDPVLLSANERLLVARVDARTQGRPGKRIRLSADPERFHYFDPATGLRLSSAPRDGGTTASAAP